MFKMQDSVKRLSLPVRGEKKCDTPSKMNLINMSFPVYVFKTQVAREDGVTLDDEYHSFSAALYSCHIIYCTCCVYNSNHNEI